MTPEPEQLDMAACADTLGTSLWQLRRAIKRGYFPESTGRDTQGRPYWHADGIYEWAARAGTVPADRIPLEYWPKATVAAPYRGTRRQSRDRSGFRWPTAGVKQFGRCGAPS